LISTRERSLIHLASWFILFSCLIKWLLRCLSKLVHTVLKMSNLQEFVFVNDENILDSWWIIATKNIITKKLSLKRKDEIWSSILRSWQLWNNCNFKRTCNCNLRSKWRQQARDNIKLFFLLRQYQTFKPPSFLSNK